MKHKSSRGFTIVELLVVIVVIGILAAITIVSYSGISAKAKTSSAQSTARAIQSKAEVYAVDTAAGLYPANLAALTTAAGTTSYSLSGSSVSFLGTTVSASSTPQTVNFWRCGTGATDTAPATTAAITVITGGRIGYWKYDPTVGVQYADFGKVTGTVGTKNIGCVMTTTINEA